MPWNFSWLVEDRLGGMARPDAAGLAWLRERGVTAIVSLTETPLEAPDGMDVLRHPVPDMTSPAPEELERIVAWVRDAIARGGKVVAHCEAGLGRTGTLLAACLVDQGRSAPEAIAQVRRARPGSIETRTQERAIHEYARRRGDPGKGATGS